MYVEEFHDQLNQKHFSNPNFLENANNVFNNSLPSIQNIPGRWVVFWRPFSTYCPSNGAICRSWYKLVDLKLHLKQTNSSLIIRAVMVQIPIKYADWNDIAQGSISYLWKWNGSKNVQIRGT